MFYYTIKAVKELQPLSITKGVPYTMENNDIKKIIQQSRIMQYEIATQIGISEYTFCKWFRKKLTAEQKEKILAAIAKIKAGEING